MPRLQKPSDAVDTLNCDSLKWVGVIDNDDDDGRTSAQHSPFQHKVMDNDGPNDSEELEALLSTFVVSQEMSDKLVEALGGADDRDRTVVRNAISNGRCNVLKTFGEFVVHPNSEKVFEELKPYQRAGVHWLMTLHRNQRNGILADEMGLGKTAQTCCFLSELYNTGALDMPTVVACPAGLVDNWCNELGRWAPSLNCMKYHGSQKERKELINIYDNSDEDTHVLVTSLQTLTASWDRAMFFRHIEFAYLVVDEAHYLKNAESKIHQQMKKKVAASRRLLLTGSPIQNQLAELRNLLLFILHDVFSSEALEMALKAYAAQIEKEKSKNSASLENPAALPKEKEDLDSALPMDLSAGDNDTAGDTQTAPDEIESQPDESSVAKKIVDRAADGEGNERDGREAVGDGAGDDKCDGDFGGHKTVDDEGKVAAAVKESTSVVSDLADLPSSKGRPLSADVECLQRLLAPFILRRLKDEVLQDLPTKTNYVQRCDMTGWQLDLYVSELRGAKTQLGFSLLKLTDMMGSDLTVKQREMLQKAAESSVSTASPQSLSSSNNSPPKSHRQTPSSDNCEAAPARRRAARDGERPSPSSLVISSAASGAKPKASKGVKEGAFVRGLVFRLRRICNHPLLVQSFFSAEDRQELVRFCATKVERFSGVSEQRVGEAVNAWSDIEVHQFAAEHLPELERFRVKPSVFLESAKIRRMLEILREVKAEGRKCLVFSQFTTYLDVIEETMTLHCPEIYFFRLDGATPIDERQNMVDRFETDESITVFMLSTKAGGVGLNLTPANTVILMDQDWNPHNDRQAEDRVHRLGQTRNVNVYRICCRGTVEESVLRCCQRKLHLDEAFGGKSELLSAAILQDSLRAHHSKSLTPNEAAEEGDEMAEPVVEFDFFGEEDTEMEETELQKKSGTKEKEKKQGRGKPEKIISRSSASSPAKGRKRRRSEMESSSRIKEDKENDIKGNQKKESEKKDVRKTSKRPKSASSRATSRASSRSGVEEAAGRSRKSRRNQH